MGTPEDVACEEYFTPPDKQDELLVEMAKWLVKNHGRDWGEEPEVIRLSYIGIARALYDIAKPIIEKRWMEKLEKTAYHKNIPVGLGQFERVVHCLCFVDDEWQAQKKHNSA